MKVKCIDNAGVARGLLIKDRVYDVQASTSKKMYELGKYGRWAKERFIVVDDASPTASSAPTASKPASTETGVDKEERRLRSILTGVAKGECACKMPKQQCWMHKD